ncbi:hypothetical protein MUG94_03400 [Arthrobacter gengyunqii]|uniref:Uncharacterized protein n=1 Tax=Arthrobacter gengyunqii TaxID=2886940 RepID=A0A9X1M2A7_9MICC|nr:hypothetical protein [Arthrobacter gengyunqii]MCC3270128.1 hypothetical protein [Arthrobacter gengyunqii]UOY96834.1 hypothetical protein MUG94_03400 [Arthrobacter gengyunqii]
MSTTVHRRSVPLLLAASCSKILPPALVLTVLVFLAGIKAGLGPAGVILLVAGIVGIPGVIYKGAKPVFRRRGLPDSWRTNIVAVLMLVGTVICWIIPLEAPIPLTVAALFLGNAGLVFFRRWLDVSAHVSVITFAVLWVTAMSGGAWAWLLVLSPLMMFSRVVLREHTRREALSGAALGVSTFCCYLVAMTWS